MPTEPTPVTPPPENTPPAAPNSPGQVFGPSNVPPVNPQPTVMPAQQATQPVNTPAGAPIPGVEVYTPQQVFNSQPQPKKWFRSKPLIIAVLALFLLMGSSGAAYFGYYLPNKPENMWGTSMVRMGKGYNKLADYIKDYRIPKGDKLNGSFKVTGDYVADGSIDLLTQGGNSQMNLTVSTSGIKAKVDAITIATDSGSPDVYFKVSGISGVENLLGPDVAAKVGSLNDQWYFADHSLADKYLSSLDATGKQPQITKDSINELINAARGPTQQYVFTSDDQKMVFVVKQAVGKEKQDGRNTYHYKIGVNKANLKAYNNALCDTVVKTKIGAMLTGDTAPTSDCKDTSDIDNIKDSDTADVWVDTHTKLVHKVRFSEKSNSNSYFDVFQDYQGGGTIPFGVGFASKSGEDVIAGNIKMSLNMDNNVFKMSGSLKATGSTKLTGSLELTLAPNSQQLKVEKPANAKNIIELLNSLGYGDILDTAGPAGSIQQKARDTERKTDINALHGQIEALYANNGSYPSLAQMNDATFRQKNMKGLDDAALQDPNSKSKLLVSSPAQNAYAYAPIPAGCDGQTKPCTDYTLTATLEAGAPYAKQSLNGPNSDDYPPVLKN